MAANEHSARISWTRAFPATDFADVELCPEPEHFVLVHGAGLASGCFSRMLRLLRNAGHDVYASTVLPADVVSVAIQSSALSHCA
jgi:hypothetical protein